MWSQRVRSNMRRAIILTQVSDEHSAKVPKKAGVWYEHRRENARKQRRRPGGYFVGTDAKEVSILEYR